MKIKLVFDDWGEHGGRSVYNTEIGVNLRAGQFHGSIVLSAEDEQQLADAMARGYSPVFYLIPDERAARKVKEK